MHWYLLGIIAATLLINHLFIHLGFVNLTYRMEIARKVYEIGEDIEISSIVENDKPLTVSCLEVHERFPESFKVKSNIYTLFVRPFQRVRRTYKVAARKRGLHAIEHVHLRLGDFIGLKSDQRYLQVDQEVIVLPEKANLKESLVPVGALTGAVSVQRWIVDDPLMTIGIREYTGTEPQRFIHWPSSLRHNQLMVKKFDFTTDNSAMVILNMETMKPCWKPVEEEIIERAISLTRGVFEELEEKKIPYGFATNAYNDSLQRKGYFYHPGLGQRHLAAFLEILGKIHYRVPSFFELTLRDIRKIRGNFTTAVIITPRILESYIQPINLLSRSLSRTVVIAVEGEHLSALNSSIIKYGGR